MKTKPVKSLAAVFGSENATRQENTSTDSIALQTLDLQFQEIYGEMDRIVETIGERTRAIFASLGIEIGHIALQWRPKDAIEGVAETLRRVEVILDVKAKL